MVPYRHAAVDLVACSSWRLPIILYPEASSLGAACLYVGMGWVAILALPVFITKLPWTALATLALGGILYTIGAVIYARKKPDPFPERTGVSRNLPPFRYCRKCGFCCLHLDLGFTVPKM